LRQLPLAGDNRDMYHATTREGTRFAVRGYANDDRDRDRLARGARWLMVRDPPDDPVGTTLEVAAQHEALALVVAARTGGRVPEPVVAYRIASGQGFPGALVAWIDTGGQSLNLVPPEEVGSATLADLWHSVASLHEHRLAHRLLRTDNITVDDSG